MANSLFKSLKASIFSEKIEKLLQFGHNLTENDKVLIRKYVQEAYELGHADGYAECCLDNREEQFKQENF